MNLDIRFFTERLRLGVVAEFVAVLDAPWGRHNVRGNIISSIATGLDRVVWPQVGPHRFASTPTTAEGTKRAEKLILDAWHEWARGGEISAADEALAEKAREMEP